MGVYDIPGYKPLGPIRQVSSTAPDGSFYYVTADGANSHGESQLINQHLSAVAPRAPVNPIHYYQGGDPSNPLSSVGNIGAGAVVGAALGLGAVGAAVLGGNNTVNNDVSKVPGVGKQWSGAARGVSTLDSGKGISSEQTTDVEQTYVQETVAEGAIAGGGALGAGDAAGDTVAAGSDTVDASTITDTVGDPAVAGDEATGYSYGLSDDGGGAVDVTTADDTQLANSYNAANAPVQSANLPAPAGTSAASSFWGNLASGAGTGAGALAVSALSNAITRKPSSSSTTTAAPTSPTGGGKGTTISVNGGGGSGANPLSGLQSLLSGLGGGQQTQLGQILSSPAVMYTGLLVVGFLVAKKAKLL